MDIEVGRLKAAGLGVIRNRFPSGNHRSGRFYRSPMAESNTLTPRGVRVLADWAGSGRC